MYALFLERMGQLYRPEKIKGKFAHYSKQMLGYLNGSEQTEDLAL